MEDESAARRERMHRRETDYIHKDVKSIKRLGKATKVLGTGMMGLALYNSYQKGKNRAVQQAITDRLEQKEGPQKKLQSRNLLNAK
jgi:hypothetical protein